MALADLSFKLYTDSGLTSLYGGTTTLTHASDLSDNPQDMVLYFGSPLTGRQLDATSNPGVDPITLTPTDILPEWVASTAYALGDNAEPTAGNGYRYEATVAGTTGASEPTWPTTVGSSVADGGVTWVCVSESHQPAEIKLATTAAGLDSATGGAALTLGTSLASESANAIEVHIRVENAVTTVSNNVGNPEVGIDINSVTETAV